MEIRFRESEDVGAAPRTYHRPSFMSLGKASVPGDPFIVGTSKAGVQPSESFHSVPHSQERGSL